MTNKTCKSCGRYGQFARDCHQLHSESAGRAPVRNQPTHTKQVNSEPEPVNQELMELLLSSCDNDMEVQTVQVAHAGSQPRCAPMQIQGIPMYFIIDIYSGADITIIGGALFQRVAAAAHLKKEDLQKSDCTPCTYDQKPFQLLTYIYIYI